MMSFFLSRGRGWKGVLLTDVGGVAAANRNSSGWVMSMSRVYEMDAAHLYSPPASMSTSSPSRRR